MAAKPADFFIGVVELFSIFLPGALLAYLFLAVAGQDALDACLPFIHNTAADWIAFIIAAYLLGHFALLAGRVLDRVYDKTYLPGKNRRQGDDLYRYVEGLQAKLLGDDAKIAKPHKWGRTNVRLRSEAGTQEIDRLEADSQFFRSVTVVLAILACVSAVQHFPMWIKLVSVVLPFGSFWCFADLRWKSVQAACLHFVVLQGIRLAPEESPVAKANS